MKKVREVQSDQYLSSSELKSRIRDIPDFPVPGILYRDIAPLLSDSRSFRSTIHCLANQFRDLPIDLIGAAEARGFLFAAPLAIELNVGLIPIRKPGKLPWKTLSYSYELEYGSNELHIHADAIPKGAKVLLLDDLLATGGTMEACAQLVEKAGGTVAACAFVIELCGLGGREKLKDYDVVSLLQY